MMTTAAPLCTPSPQRIAEARITAFTAFVNQTTGLQLGPNYDALYQWSIQQPEQFWSAVWHYCEVIGEGSVESVLLDGHLFPGARWFPKARLNFAENLLRRRDAQPALISLL